MREGSSCSRSTPKWRMTGALTSALTAPRKESSREEDWTDVRHSTETSFMARRDWAMSGIWSAVMGVGV